MQNSKANEVKSKENNYKKSKFENKQGGKNKKIHDKKLKKFNLQFQTEKKNRSKNLWIKILAFAVIVVIAGIITFVSQNKNMTKNFKIGNNKSSQEIVENILNISSYTSQIDVEVKSNKNSNKYKIKQNYIDKDNGMQEVEEPENIHGVRIIKEQNKIKIENTKLSLVKILENYKEITQNVLDLSTFIENYKSNETSSFKEENGQIIMETSTKINNNYQKYEKLYISKETGKPTKMEIEDTNKNTIIYIIYNEINY